MTNRTIVPDEVHVAAKRGFIRTATQSLASVVSLLTSIASNPVGDRGTAAVVGRYAAN